MAQVALKRPDTLPIDDFLEYLLREWRMLDWVDSEWNSWEEHERLNFVVEWPLREDRLRQLRQWEEQGMLSLEQGSRFGQLLHLVERQQSTLDRLLAE